jgi:hypothetical protein
MKNSVFWDVIAATLSGWFLARGLSFPEDGGDTFLQNIGSHKIYRAPHPRRRHSCKYLVMLLQLITNIIFTGINYFSLNLFNFIGFG